ncbi:MAG: hypothetical protein QXQ43_03665 [Nitrososphaerota archaeon]
MDQEDRFKKVLEYLKRNIDIAKIKRYVQLDDDPNDPIVYNITLRLSDIADILSFEDEEYLRLILRKADPMDLIMAAIKELDKAYEYVFGPLSDYASDGINKYIDKLFSGENVDTPELEDNYYEDLNNNDEDINFDEEDIDSSDWEDSDEDD